jgi:hypothetical protein
LANINKCFSSSEHNSPDSVRGKILERQNIFKNATMVDIVKKKGNTLKYWYKYVAVLSGSYIYFYNYEDYQIIREVFAYSQQSQNRKEANVGIRKRRPSANIDDDEKSDNDDKSVSLSEESEKPQ